MKLVKKIKKGVKKVARIDGTMNTQMGKLVTGAGKVGKKVAPLVTVAGLATGQPEIAAAGVALGAGSELAVRGGRVQKNYGRALKKYSKGKDGSKEARKSVTGAFSLGKDYIESQNKPGEN